MNRTRPLISEEDTRRLVEEAVRKTSAEHPGDAEAMKAALHDVWRVWSRDWVTSIMGGDGGTTVFAERGALYIGYRWLGRDWESKFEWREGQWVETEAYDGYLEGWGLVDAFMSGLHFDSPNAYL
ncbi:hypothetical protein [Polyangium jinanense]|uniref:Uncharacterized protein n=1 Tax=Polyangium jinanense TaxID=2829994 RepID=A0A9X3X2V6_9BACT|nr:hypothetical protein [Polyangium jinanense]MDC3981495.1 hypothetical protein [Polyangium jinanense]